LRIGTTGDYPPLTYYNHKTGEFFGTDIAKALALGKNLGRKVVFIKTTWPELSADLMADKFDIAMGGISASPERENKFLLSKSVLTENKVPVTLCKKSENYNAIEKINQPTVRIVENKGSTNETLAKQFFPTAKFILIESNLDTFNYLLTDKADVMITDKTEALYRQKTMPDLCVVNLDHPLATFNKVYLLKKTDAKLLKQVNSWIESY
jgi:cyclohexadienyl dehydratase